MTSTELHQRINLGQSVPGAYKAALDLSKAAGRAAVDAGLDPKLVELVKLRASQLNGCAFCLDMHSRDTIKLGENPRRLFVLAAWRETELFTEQERAALALAEAMTNLPIDRDVPDEVYQQAAKVFTDEQLAAVAWVATAINTLNRLGVFSRLALPADPA